MPQYVIITPVRDEAGYIELTIASVASQTHPPALWVIVDDGSKDRTPAIVSQYTAANTFIRLVRNPQAGVRQTGSAVIRAFNLGLQSVSDRIHYDFIVKLDGDLSFEPNYFQNMFERFSEDPKLGIASGAYFEKGRHRSWREVRMPAYHAAGACKVIRRECFEVIGGFVPAAGWDTVDEIRAISRGWTTRHFRDLRMRHHKPEGSGIGMIKTGIMHGEIYYLTGGGRLFLLFKILHRLAERPYIVGALALLWGYLKAVCGRKALLVTTTEAKCYKGLLNGRLRTMAKSLLLQG